MTEKRWKTWELVNAQVLHRVENGERGQVVLERVDVVNTDTGDELRLLKVWESLRDGRRSFSVSLPLEVWRRVLQGLPAR